MTSHRTPSTLSPFRLVAVSVVALGAASLVSTLSFDHPVMERLSGRPVNWHLIWWVHALCSLGKAEVPVWLVAVFAVATRRAKPLMVTLAALILSTAVVVPLKVAVHRTRPQAGLASRQGVPPSQTFTTYDWTSFPSGDASTAFAVATALSHCMAGLWRPLLYALAVAISALRVTSLHHFPSDVFAGAAVGLLAGYLAISFYGRVPLLQVLGLRLGHAPWRGLLAAILVLTPCVMALVDRGNPLVTFLKVCGVPILVGYAAFFVLDRRPQGNGSSPPSLPGADRSL